MSWDDGGVLDTTYGNAPAELHCPEAGCAKLVMSPRETCHRAGELRRGDNVYCACCGRSRRVSAQALEYSERLEELFVNAGY